MRGPQRAARRVWREGIAAARRIGPSSAGRGCALRTADRTSAADTFGSERRRRRAAALRPSPRPTARSRAALCLTDLHSLNAPDDLDDREQMNSECPALCAARRSLRDCTPPRSASRRGGFPSRRRAPASRCTSCGTPSVGWFASRSPSRPTRRTPTDSTRSAAASSSSGSLSTFFSLSALQSLLEEVGPSFSPETSRTRPQCAGRSSHLINRNPDKNCAADFHAVNPVPLIRPLICLFEG